MKQLILCLQFSWGLIIAAHAQTVITGKVIDQKGMPIIGASLSLEGTYDGTVSELDGSFRFETRETGVVQLLISYLGFENKSIKEAVTELADLEIVLRASAMTLDAVEVSASTFKAGDNSKLAVLKPLDIVTTAGAMGDVIGALQTLPGTQSNPEDGRLFIRGGDARETNIYVDGLKVFSPFIRTLTGVPTRGRFSPFLFKGVSFSTGGYSAAYGQALSGVLDMNTIDEPTGNETNISIMTVGLGLGHTQKWERQSISINTSYIDLTPYAWVAPSRTDWLDPYAGFSGEAVYRYKTRNGRIKSYWSGESSGFRLLRENINTTQEEDIQIRNRNIYSNTSYTEILNDQTSLFAGISFGYNSDDLRVLESVDNKTQLHGLHARLALKTVLKDRLVVNYGIEYLKEDDKMAGSVDEFDFSEQLHRNMAGAFVETDYFFSKNLAVKLGGRAEYHALSKEMQWDPRLTIAAKLSDNSQVSAAYGRFTQALNADFLYRNPDLAQEKSSHYLINYNYKSDQQILRIESYYKRYDDLLKFSELPNRDTDFNSTGSGYAYGVDLFWRANQLVKNLDFWVSYSWLEHQRDYRDFPEAATPRFSTAHNLSVVTKTWLPKWRSQLGITANLMSGRPYENPNTSGFLNERSTLYRSLNLSWAYLISPQKILFFSVSNAPGFRNDFGYEYAELRNVDGIFPGRLIRPDEDRIFFAGLFITFSRDRTKNQLNNL